MDLIMILDIPAMIPVMIPVSMFVTILIILVIYSRFDCHMICNSDSICLGFLWHETKVYI